ncbi:phage tail sheath C-terminal domain-containing protein [Streptomyces noboritoensis]|uniref:Phage tail sheath C-terminal domain-containing protein n=1 Tax=Streptomyces noboritoensis TaxID=67337 RepID=A0ABV6T8M6_9ACTN
MSDEEQGENPSLNFLRVFSGYGTLVWGARTLAASQSTEWRYIPVRRLADTLARDVSTALQSVVFEPNTQPTWEKVRAAIDTYLYRLWQQGGLQGTKVEESYFIQIGKGITMTEQDITDGRLIVKTGIAPVRPAEFIVQQHTITLDQG